MTIFHGIDRPERLDSVTGWLFGDDRQQVGGEDLTAGFYHPSRAGHPAFDRWIAEDLAPYAEDAARRRGAPVRRS